MTISTSRALAFLLSFLLLSSSTLGQTKKPQRTGAHSSGSRESMPGEVRELVEEAMDVVCTERRQDAKGSVPIDDMQARPSIPIHSPEAVAAAARAQQILPETKQLVIVVLRQLATEYGVDRSPRLKASLQQAISRLRLVKRIKPDMDSRDNASVLLKNPHTITFGTIFLAGLPSEEGMISVLGHELVHVADGDQDSLEVLFRAVGTRASGLTGFRIHHQRAEELTCDLVGALAARLFVSRSPSYEPLPRRIARSIGHNCVSDDEGDEDHLSPRNTIRALLALNPAMIRELIGGREEGITR